MPIQKTAVRAAAVLASAAFLAACQSKSSDSDGTTPRTPSSPVAAATTPSSDTGGSTGTPAAASGSVLNGTKLTTLLPTTSQVPSGWKLDDSAAFDTGGTVKPPSDPLLPGDGCAEALTNGGAQTLTSDYQAAYAMTGLTNPNGGSSNVVFNSYEPGDAVKQMNEVSTLVKRCASFTTQDINGKSVKMSAVAKAVTGLGDQALDLKVTPSGDYVSDEIVLVRSGNIIMAVDEDSSAGPMAALMPVAKQLAKPLPPKS